VLNIIGAAESCGHMRTSYEASLGVRPKRTVKALASGGLVASVVLAGLLRVHLYVAGRKTNSIGTSGCCRNSISSSNNSAVKEVKCRRKRLFNSRSEQVGNSMKPVSGRKPELIEIRDRKPVWGSSTNSNNSHNAGSSSSGNSSSNRSGSSNSSNSSYKQQ
jgi:hypothetical protein